jgi:XRE family transcriptional regulator, thiamine biosynthesis regulator
MRPACIVIVEEVLPEVRRSLAKDLYSQGMSQETISSILGVSQAMVSKYLKEDPNRPGSLHLAVESLSRSLSVYAMQGASPDEMTEMFCRGCSDLLCSDALARRYAERFPGSRFTRCDRSSGHDDRSMVLVELEASIKYLSKYPIGQLIPAVKMNIAQCVRDAGDRGDVASFPGRIQDVDGTINQILPPRFGASKHLADFLLEAHSYDPSILAVANTRLSNEVRMAFFKLGIELSYLERGPVGIMPFGDQVKEGSRVLADPGDFGIEPCLYVLGRSSLELTRTLVDVHKIIVGSGGKDNG